jgi:hypothetical protein
MTLRALLPCGLLWQQRSCLANNGVAVEASLINSSGCGHSGIWGVGVRGLYIQFQGSTKGGEGRSFSGEMVGGTYPFFQPGERKHLHLGKF